jgi:Leucine-rich repeat (LRR) protein
MSENKLTNCAGLAKMPKLIELNLAGNQITTLTDLKNLPSLKKLEVGKNKMENL